MTCDNHNTKSSNGDHQVAPVAHPTTNNVITNHSAKTGVIFLRDFELTIKALPFRWQDLTGLENAQDAFHLLVPKDGVLVVDQLCGSWNKYLQQFRYHILMDTFEKWADYCFKTNEMNKHCLLDKSMVGEQEGEQGSSSSPMFLRAGSAAAHLSNKKYIRPIWKKEHFQPVQRLKQQKINLKQKARIKRLVACIKARKQGRKLEAKIGNEDLLKQLDQYKITTLDLQQMAAQVRSLKDLIKGLRQDRADVQDLSLRILDLPNQLEEEKKHTRESIALHNGLRGVADGARANNPQGQAAQNGLQKMKLLRAVQRLKGLQGRR
ncbi:unnamed protein product [Amoebophrya sp. A120]|nr:unnamed protein product [Amoebophrya sp. A120]|eukprot:GSA120T00000824001.1